MKKFIKQFVREDRWAFLSWYRHRFGIFQAISGFIGLTFNGKVGSAPNPFLKSNVYVRPGTTDQDVYDEIFIFKEYEIDLGTPLFIIDAGAHIGLSSVFFACKYPQAIVVAIEPELSNFEMLLMNTKDYPNIKPMNVGLWSHKAFLSIEDTDVPTWSFRVVENQSGQGIPAVGISDILADFNVNQIDVLKIDIEGSEVEVLNQSQAWIDTVQTLVIELHDRFRPGCSEALKNALLNHAYDKSKSGESIVISHLRKAFANNPPVKTS